MHRTSGIVSGARRTYRSSPIIPAHCTPLADALRETVMAQGVIHADETPVQMLAPGEKKTHRAYIWAGRMTSPKPDP